MASTSSSGAQMLLVLSVFLLSVAPKSGDAASFKLNIHHRFSDSVKGLLYSEGLPKKHTPEYYATMVHRDRLVRGRRLAGTNDDTKLTFAYGNDTYNIADLGFLYYANVSVGTPPLDFLVALDTGSDLFWLPCECRSCLTYLNTTDGDKFMLNHYSPNDSTTSATVPCSSSLCALSNQCTANQNTCPYEIYHPGNTSSSGYLVQDVLHLATDDSQFKPVEAKIALGCGKFQTGAFAELAAPNGLIGLGMESISVPSLLANQGLASDSFSMCFEINGYGRIDFGDTGTPGQRETPINTMLNSPSYNVTFTQIIIGGKTNNVQFTAIFNSAISFTYLAEPVYSLITDQMDAGMKLERYSFGVDFPFEYCYELPSNTKAVSRLILNFTMKGGDDYVPEDLFFDIPIDDKGNRTASCLALLKTTDINQIGQNWMNGYRIFFNREKMVLGWTPSDCNDNGADAPPSDDSPPSSSSPPSRSSPPADDSPPSDESPPPPPSRRGSNGIPNIGTGSGYATPVNPLASVFVVVLAVLAVV